MTIVITTVIAELIQSIANENERNAVDQIYRKYYKFMVAKAFDILKNMPDAEDAVQETFYRISCNVEDFLHPERTETAALISVYTHNVAVNMYNKKKRQSNLFDQSGDFEEIAEACMDPDEDLDQIVVNNETIDIVRFAVNRLDNPYRQVVLLKYFYNMKNTEIAEYLGIDHNTINWRIFRAKQLLREILGEDGYERITCR